MNMRKDAGIGMAEAMIEFNKLGMKEIKHQGRVTIGSIQLTPNSPNVIPGRANFTLEIRHPDQQALNRLDKEIYKIVNNISNKYQLDGQIKQVVNLPPLVFNSDLLKIIRQIADKLGYSREDIVSGAGHDSCHLNNEMPTAMIFIPCIDGLSHNEQENITDEWCEKGGNILFNMLLKLAS